MSKLPQGVFLCKNSAKGAHMSKESNSTGGAWQLAEGTRAEEASGDQIVQQEQVEAAIVAVVAQLAADKAKARDELIEKYDGIKSY